MISSNDSQQGPVLDINKDTIECKAYIGKKFIRENWSYFRPVIQIINIISISLFSKSI